MIYLQLFLAFFKVGALSFGGGYAALPLIQGEVVNTFGWLTTNQFLDLITISQMTPGPIAINSATFVGIQLAGLPGAVAATAGCIFPSCILVTFLAFLYTRYKNMSLMNGVLRTLRPAIIALIAAAGVDIFLSAVLTAGTVSGITASIRWEQIVFFAAAFFLLRKTRWNPVFIMAGCGVGEMLFQYFVK